MDVLAEPSQAFQVLRPKPEAGYFSVGDTLVRSDASEPPKALLIKDKKSVMAPPDKFLEVWKDPAKVSGGKTVQAKSLWKPVPPKGYVCLGHVLTLGTAKPSTDLVRCIKKHLVETIEKGSSYPIHKGTV